MPFDEVDVTVSSERQQESFALMKKLITQNYNFNDKDECREFFTKITGLYKNFNYSPIDAPAYKNYKQEIMTLSDKYTGI